MDGQYLAVATDDAYVHVWEVRPQREVAGFKYQGVAKAIAISPDAKSLSAVVSSGQISRAGEVLTAWLWKVPRGEEVRSFKLGWDRAISYYTLSPDGRYLAAGGAIVEMTSGREVLKVGAIASAFSTDGRYLATINQLYLATILQGGAAEVWEAKVWEITGREGVARMEHDLEVRDVVFSRNGKYLATISQDGVVRVWLLRQEDLIAEARRRLKH